MGFVGLVQFAVKYFFDVLAWPFFALGYPLYASVMAIEHNSVADTQKLNTYWVVFSLILLLEHVLNLLEWLFLWQYVRLMIVCCLVAPYFDGAFYVYKNLIRPCLSMDLQNVINWFNKRMESLYAKDNVLNEMEKYINENGPEALEKIIARKSGGTMQNLDVKDIKASSSTENKEVEQLNSERPTVTQKYIQFGCTTQNRDVKDIKASPSRKNKEVEQLKSERPTVTQKYIQFGCTMQNLDVKDIKASPPTENKEVEQLNSERPTVTQKDIRLLEVLEKNEVKSPKQDSGVQPNVTRVENRNFAGQEIKKPVPEVATQRELPETPASTKGQKLICEICNVTLQSENALDYHLEGENHQAAVEALKAEIQSSGPKAVHNFVGPEIKKPVCKAAAQRALPQASASGKGQKLTCEICHKKLHNVINLNSHLQGKKQRAAVEALKAKLQSSGPKVAPTDIPKNSNVPNVKPGKSGLQKEYPGNAEVRGQQQGNPASVPRESVQHWDWDWGQQKEYPGNAELRGRQQGNPASFPRESVQHWGWDWGPQNEYPVNAEVRGQQQGNPASVARESVQHWGWDWGRQNEYPVNAVVQGQQQGNPASVPRESVQHWGWDWGPHEEYPVNAVFRGQHLWGWD